MGRPRKNTVDWFPHICNHSKTLLIIEQKYGIAGYAFWFKLLEILGSTENHFIDCRNPCIWEFLQVKTQQTEETTLEILNLLAKLEAIDKGLWEKRIVWCQNFVDGVAELYRNRRVDIPLKPSIYDENTPKEDVSTSKYIRELSENGVSTPEYIQSTPENPQSRVEESRVEKREKEKEIYKEKESPPADAVGGSENFIDILLNLFCEEYSVTRGYDFALVGKGKEQSAIGKLLADYKVRNKDSPPDTEQTKDYFWEFFRQCLKISDKWHNERMSPSHILNQYNSIQSIIKKGNNGFDRENHSKSGYRRPDWSR